MKSRNRQHDERFEMLYRRYKVRIVRYYMKAFGFSKDVAEELTQDAFVRVYQAMDRHRGDAIWAYLETVARNVAANYFRAKKTQKRDGKMIPTDDPELKSRPLLAREERDYGIMEEERRRRERLVQEIDRLPRGERDCVLLWLQERKYGEIAIILKITTDAVKSRLRDAKRHLRDRLGDDGDLPEETP